MNVGKGVGSDFQFSFDVVCCCVRSAGLVAHPQFVVDSKSFLLSLGLHAAPGVSLLDYLPHSLG